MTKIISYSLWGNDTRYTLGAIRNAELAKEIYPDWDVHIYISDHVEKEIQNKLTDLDCTLIKFSEAGDWTGMFWRFFAADSQDVMISRDVDSRLSYREKAAVDEWLDSNKDFHIMRDHPYHATAILGGMWGARNGILSGIKDMIHNYTKGDYWQIDQEFLKDVIYPIVKDRAYVHDPFFERKPFPFPRNDKHFVGQAYRGDDRILDDNPYFQILDREKYENSCKRTI
jgi:hypothetical protein